MVDNALVTLVQRLDKNPDDAEALQAVWRALMERRQYQQLATLAEKLAERRKDPHSAADLLYQAGDLWGVQLNRIDKAQADYKRAVDLFPAHPRAARRLREIYISQQRYPLAAQLFEAEINATSNARERAELLLEYAEVLEKLADAPGQIKALREVVSLTPRDHDASRKLARLLLARAGTGPAGDDDRQAAAKLLGNVAQGLGGSEGLKYAEGALQVWPGEETAYRLMEAALTTSGKIDDLVRRQIEFLTANPGSKLATGIRKDLAMRYERWGRIESAIETLVPLSGSDEEATRNLARLYELSGRHADLAKLMASQPGSDNPGERVASLVKRAALLEQAGDHTARIAALREIVSVDPAHRGALDQLEQDCRDRSAFDELRQVLYLQARVPGVSSEQARHRNREAALLSERIGDLPRAIECWQAVAASDPTHAEAIAALDRILPYAERWDEYARWLATRVERSQSADEKRSLRLKLAEVHRDKRKDGGSECAVLAALFDADPEDDTVAALLTDARVRAGDPGAALGILRKRAASATEANAVARWSQFAARLEADGHADEALEAWRKVRTLDASQSSAWEAEERLLEAAGRREELLDALEAHAHHPGAAGTRAGELYARAAALALDLGDRERALAQADRAFRLSPGDEKLADMYGRLCEASGDKARLRAFWQTRAEQLPHGLARVETLRKLAQSYARGDDAWAPAWQSVREASRHARLGPDDEALEKLAEIARASGDNAALATVLEEWADASEDPGVQRTRLMERAELLAGPLGQPDEALAAFGYIVDKIDPTHVRAWSRLADMAQRTGEPELEAEALEKCLELSRERLERKTWALRLATVCESALDDADRAADALAAWLRDGGDEPATVARLEKLYEWLSRWEDLAPLLEAAIAREDDPAKRDAAMIRWARVVGDRLDEPERAFARLAERYRGGGSGMIETLRALANRGGLVDELAELLREEDEEEADEPSPAPASAAKSSPPPARSAVENADENDEEDSEVDEDDEGAPTSDEVDREEPVATRPTSAAPPPVRDEDDGEDDAERDEDEDDDAETREPSPPPPIVALPPVIPERPAVVPPVRTVSERPAPSLADAPPPLFDDPPTVLASKPSLDEPAPAVASSDDDDGDGDDDNDNDDESARTPTEPPDETAVPATLPPPVVEAPPTIPPAPIEPPRAVVPLPAPPRIAPASVRPPPGPPPAVLSPAPTTLGRGLVLDDESSPVLDDVETTRLAPRAPPRIDVPPPAPSAPESTARADSPQEPAVSHDPPSGDSAESTNPRLSPPDEDAPAPPPPPKPLVQSTRPLGSVRPPPPAPASSDDDDEAEALELESDEIEIIDADEGDDDEASRVTDAPRPTPAVSAGTKTFDERDEQVITETKLPAVGSRPPVTAPVPVPLASKTATTPMPTTLRSSVRPPPRVAPPPPTPTGDSADEVTPAEGVPLERVAHGDQTAIPTPVPPPPTPADMDTPSIIVDDSALDPSAPASAAEIDPHDRAYIRTPVPPAMPEPTGLPVFEPPPPPPQFNVPPLFGAPPPGFPPPGPAFSSPPAGFPPAPHQGPPPGFGGPPPGFPPAGPAFSGPPAGFPPAPPPGFGGPPPGFGGPPAGFPPPPAGFGGPPPGFGGPPPGFGGPPPGFGGPPAGFNTPPAGFPPPPAGLGGPPAGFPPPAPAFSGPAFSSPNADSSGPVSAVQASPLATPAQPRRVYQRTMAALFDQARGRAGLPARR